MIDPVNDGTLFFPPQASTLASDVDTLFYFLFYLSTFASCAILGAAIYFVLKYRHREGGPEAVPISHHTLLEMAWSIIPLFIFIIIFAWGYKGFINMAIAPKDAVEVHVTAKKWLWGFEHKNGIKESGELHVPLHKPIKLIMASDDVIHSFFVPSFRVKQDVIPNRYTTLWFEATQSGPHQVFCTEYCGTGHSDMLAKVIVMEPKAYEDWEKSMSGPTADQIKDPQWMAKKGKELFTKNACATCHADSDSSPAVTCPKLLHKFGTVEALEGGTTTVVDENYIRESILQPTAKIVKGYQPVMPTFQGLLNEWQIKALIEYLKSLK